MVVGSSIFIFSTFVRRFRADDPVERTDTYSEDAFTSAFPGERRAKLSYVAPTFALQCLRHSPCLLVSEVSYLSVRVSREDDNAHGIAVTRFSAPTRDRGIVVYFARRIRLKTRDASGIVLLVKLD